MIPFSCLLFQTIILKCLFEITVSMYSGVLDLAGVEMLFFLVAGMGLGFGFVLNTG